MIKLPNVQTGVILAPFTTFKIGGPANYYLKANSVLEIITAVKAAKSAGLPIFILGQGSNILIGDLGFRGLVIHNLTHSFSFQKSRLIVDSGATIADLIQVAADRGLSGLEHFAGIVSSVGGALWQNLHFLSPDRHSTIFIDSLLTSAQILQPDGAIIQVDHDYFEFGYDTSILHTRPVTVLSATFSLQPEPPAIIRQRIEANLEWRRLKHPPLNQFPSAGSVFKKISGVGAGRLIESAGLKGYQIGDAQVSPQHANFIVNLGNATAIDVRTLINHIQTTVFRHSGYQLEPEISFVGEYSQS